MISYILGLDLGGTKVSAAVLDGEGNIISRARAKTRAWRDDEEVFATISRVGHRAVERAGIPVTRLSALGIGTPGPLDPVSGYIIEAANLRFRNFPLGPRLAEEFGCPVTVDNDVNAGLYGELKMGAARGANDVIGLFIGTGIGGGIIANGELYHGFSRNAGEFGHMIIQAEGPRCGCGRRGCIEAIASRTAMTRDLKKAIKRGEKSQLAKLLEKKNENITSRDLKQAFDDGDQLATKTVLRTAKYLGIAIGSLINVFGPQVVVLGGGVIEAFGQSLIERIDRAARKIAFEFAIKDVRIIKAELGDDAGVIGAAMLARRSLLKD
ncbi:MAG TPA: ROK family protein [Blastocatellia bacterium]|nr:ROK family protein [Blastocatellia bacterium]